MEKAPLETIDAILCWGWPDGLEEAAPRLKRLRRIQRIPSGADTLPPGLAKALPKLEVASGAGSNAAWVAEHAFALVLACAKRVAWHDARMRRGKFPQMERPSLKLDGATLGILGYGAVGRRVARIAEGFGMRVLALRRHPSPEDPENVYSGLDGYRRVLSQSDALVVCVPLTEATRGLVDAAALATMRPEAILVNVARGDVVDPNALYDHLRAHPDFFAGLDVWWTYPRPGQPFEQPRPFADLENVVMTPHAAAVIPSFRSRMVRWAATDLARALSPS